MLKILYKYFILYIFLVSYNWCCFGVGSTAASAAFSGVSTGVGILSKFFIGNSLLSKLLGTFSFALNTNRKLIKEEFFSGVFVPFPKSFNSMTKLLCLRSDQKYP